MAQRDPIQVYDARWIASEFDDTQVRRLFEATLIYARSLDVDTVTVARDARLAAPHVMELAIDIAVRAGFRVVACVGPVSTPHSYFATLHVTRRHPSTMGLTITASHNPAEYVGVKFVVPVVRAIGMDCGPNGGLTEIRRLYHDIETLEPIDTGSLEVLDLNDEFVTASMRQAAVAPGDLAGLRVVLDGFHGSGGPEMKTALQRAGATVEPLRLVPDGRFPTGSPNPTSQGKMDQAIALAATHDAHVVIGLDGDGDRIVLGDRRGLLAAGFAAIPVLQACLASTTTARTVPVLYDPKVNPLALAQWCKLGVEPVLFRNGHSQIKERMQQIGALAAAEESGHYYHRVTEGDLTVSCENSLLTVLLFLRAVKSQPDLMDRLWALQQQVATTGEFNYQFADDDTRDRAMVAVIDDMTSQGADATTTSSDGTDLAGTVLTRGVRRDDADLALDPGWFSGYLRIATNENAVVRSYYSAGDPEVLARIESRTRDILANRFGGCVID